MKIKQGIAKRFTNCLFPSQMNDCIYPVLAENIIQYRAVAHVTPNQGHTFLGDTFDLFND